MADKWEKTIVIIKPDAVERHLVGAILARFERAGFTILEMQLRTPSIYAWQDHYAEHKDKDHFYALTKRMSNRDAICILFGAIDAIRQARKLIGPTNTHEAPPGTIRGDFGRFSDIIADNLIHASDGPEAAEREYKFWLPERHWDDVEGKKP